MQVSANIAQITRTTDPDGLYLADSGRNIIVFHDLDTDQDTTIMSIPFPRAVTGVAVFHDDDEIKFTFAAYNEGGRAFVAWSNMTGTGWWDVSFSMPGTFGRMFSTMDSNHAYVLLNTTKVVKFRTSHPENPSQSIVWEPPSTFIRDIAYDEDSDWHWGISSTQNQVFWGEGTRGDDRKHTLTLPGAPLALDFVDGGDDFDYQSNRTDNGAPTALLGAGGLASLAAATLAAVALFLF
jgi:hypothetical protein